MSIRRLFWLGAAVLLSVAALVAIAAVLGGGFGDTQARILATCGIAFVCGGAALTGHACVDRGVIHSVGWVTVGVGAASFAVWTGAAWKESPGSGYWRLAGVFGVWTLAALIVTTLRLPTSSPRLLSTLLPASDGARRGAAARHLGNVEFFAVAGEGRSVTIGSTRVARLGSSEGIVLRRRS